MDDLLFTIGIILVIVLVFFGGFAAGYDDKIESKTPIKPTVKIECLENKCDTTYIYKKHDK